MKQLYLLLISVVCSFVLISEAKGQACNTCTATVPEHIIDLSANPDTTVTKLGLTRAGQCCGATNPRVCIKFIVKIHPSATEFYFEKIGGNNGKYRIDCGPEMDGGEATCYSGPTTFCVTFCDPGGNAEDYILSTSRGFRASADLKLRAGNSCTGLMEVSGLQESTIFWTSIFPGAPGDYNGYLSCVSNCDTTTVSLTSLPPGITYIDYEVRGIANGCLGGLAKRDTVRVYAYPALTIDIAPALPAICNTGGSVELLATPTGGNAPYTYSWTGPNGFSSNLANPTVNEVGNYTVSISDNTDCAPVTQSINVISSITPEVNSASIGSVCSGVAQNYTIESTTGATTTYSWSRGFVGGIANAAVAGQTSNPIVEALVNNTNAPIDVIYQITPTDNGCTGSVFTYTVTVQPTATVTSLATGAICNNTAQNYDITSNVVGATFSWSRVAVPSITNAAVAGQTADPITESLVNTTNASIDVTYVITPVVNGCDGTPFNYVVSVRPTTTVTSLATGAICNNTAQNYDITSNVVGATFSWSRVVVPGITNAAVAGQTADPITESLVNTTNASIDVTYLITPVVNGCDGTPFNYVVTINPTPAIQNVPVTATICNNTATNIVLDATAPSTFAWTIGNIVGGITGATAGSGNTIAQTLLNPSNTTAGTVEYLITPTSTGGLCPAAAPYVVTVTVNPTPEVTNAPPAAICNGGTFNINLTSSAPSTFTWTVGNIVGGITGASNGSGNVINQVLINPSSVSSGSVEYLVTPTSLEGCLGPVSSIIATVTIHPIPVITNQPTKAICNNTNTSIPLTVSTPSTFTWTLGNVSANISGATAGNGTDINQILINSSNSVAGTVEYIVVPTSIAGGCVGDSFRITVTVNPTPEITGVPNAFSICNNTSTNIVLNATAPSTFSWTLGNVSTNISGALAGNGSTISQVLTNNSNSTPGTVEYLVMPTSTDGNCNASSLYLITVTVNPTPEITGVPNALAICNNTSPDIALTATAQSTFAWTLGNVSANINGAAAGNGATISQVLTNTSSSVSGTVEYFVTPTSTVGNCPASSPYMITVTVEPTTTISSAATGVVCSDAAQNYIFTSPVIGTVYTWTRAVVTGISNAAGSGSTNTITEILTNTTDAPVDVVYIITPSINGCPNPVNFTYTVTVNPTPIINSVAAEAVCSGSALNYLITNNVTGTTYLWDRAVAAGITNAAVTNQTNNPITETLINSTNDPVNATYIITPSANGCTGPDFQYTAIVNPTATVSSDATDVICSGVAQNYDITSPVSGTTYTWSRNAVAGISNPAVTAQAADPITETLINTTNLPINVVYIIVPSANGCINPAPFQYTVTVNPIPVITSTGTGVVCSDVAQNHSFSSTVTNTTYAWTRSVVGGISNPASSGINDITEALTNTTNTPVDVTYSVIPSANGCANPVASTYTVTVNPTPLVTSPLSGIVCSAINDIYNIAGNVTGSTFTWTRDAVPGISNPPVVNQPSAIIDETLNNTTGSTINVQYEIIPTANGCTGPLFLYSKDVKPTPLQPVVNNNGPFCVGATLSLTSSPYSGATYQWNGPNGFNSTLQNPTRSSLTFADAGTYSVAVTFNGCTSPSGTTNVVVSNQPSIANAGTNEIICAGNTLTLNGSITGGSTSGVWSTSGSGIFTANNTDLGATYIPSNADTASGSVTLTLTSTNNGACASSSSSIVITISDRPTADAGNDRGICSYGTVQLNGSVGVVSTGIWTTNGTGTFQPSATDLNATYIPSDEDIRNRNVRFILTTTNNNGCIPAQDSVLIDVIPAPTVNAGGLRYVLEGNSISLIPVITNGVSYLWTGPTQWLNSTTQANVVATPRADAEYIITVTGLGGCTATDTANIIVLPPPEIPNVFSPNGDGTNDTWVIKALEKYPNAVVQVFTRYGQQILNSKGKYTPWDGTFKGKQMPVGTYYYIIEPNNGRPRFSGYVVILR